jgi:regulator of sigma D
MSDVLQENAKDILKNNDVVNSINTKLEELINYNTELELMTMNIGLKDKNKDNLISTIHESYYIDVEQAKIKGGFIFTY